jgi:AcrR family transcriptional regulator
MPLETDRPALRQDAILDAAFAAFSSYGYKRTSMEDIAQAVGISRSALYLHFRNKEDILRSLSTRFFDDAAVNIAAELGVPDRPTAETLGAAFVAYDGKFMDVFLSTPHGTEILEAGHQVSADLVAAGEARIHQLLANWLMDLPLPAILGGADALAATILASLKGLKHTAKTPQGYRASQAQLAQVLALALGR